MIKRFILNLRFVQKEINGLKKELNIANVGATYEKIAHEKTKAEIKLSTTGKQESDKHNAGVINELSVKIKKREEDIKELQLRNQELIRGKNEANRLLSESKSALLPKDEKDRQINNLKKKIGELEIEIENQKNITFKKNQELNNK